MKSENHNITISYNQLQLDNKIKLLKLKKETLLKLKTFLSFAFSFYGERARAKEVWQKGANFLKDDAYDE